MKTFNHSSLLLFTIFLMLWRVDSCSSLARNFREQQKPQTSKPQKVSKNSPCYYDARTDRVKDELQCDKLVRELGEAAVVGDIQKMKLAIERGASVEYMENSHAPVLFTAIENGQKEAVVFLIEQGADVNARIADGYMPLEAVPKGRSDIREILLAHGAQSY